ncbi:MAG: tetratricopeptide repeat protein [Calditrichaeota bacterium]|nr:tetratricopeptide repeat protein [Calditrichota bacterium]
MFPIEKKILTALGILFWILPLYAGDNSQQAVKLGLHYGILNFQGDVSPDKIGNYGEGTVTFPVSKKFSVLLAGGYGVQRFIPYSTLLNTQLITSDVRGIFRFPVHSFISPKFYLGASIIYFTRGNWPSYWDGAGLAGGGFDIGLSKRLSLSFTADYRFTTGDDFDGIANGGKDAYLTAKAGIQYSLPTKESHKSHLLARTLEYHDGGEQQRSNLPNWVNATETSATGNVIASKTVATPDTADINRIQMLDDLIYVRNETIQAVKNKLRKLDQKISSLETVLEQKSPSRTETLSTEDFYNEYKIAVQKFDERDYSAAANIFKSLMAQDPTNRLASNCQYWIGECEYATKNFEKAVDAFQRTLEYPNSTKTDDALIMLGLSFKKINQFKVAKQYFERLLAEYPDSEYANLAKRSIASL